MKNRKIIFWTLGAAAFGLLALLQGIGISVVAVVLAYVTFYLYYALRSVIPDPINAFFALMASILVLSFMEARYQAPVTLAIVFLGLIYGLIKLRLIRKIILADAPAFSEITCGDAVAWFLLFLFVASFGFMTPQGFSTLDFNHPTYELSIGRSYDLSILQPPDLSYTGKFLRYHFLSTQLPAYFAHVLQVPVLSALYFFLPFFLLFLSFLLVHFFFAKYPTMRLPVFLLAFTPLFASSFIDMEGLFQGIISPNSFFVAFILMTLAVYYLAGEKFVLFVIAALLLLITKASFFLVALGGSVLFLLRTRDFKKLFCVLAVLLPGFAVGFKLFLSGAHQHNSWIVFPSVIYSRNWEVIFIPVVLFVAAATVYFRQPHDKLLLALSSVSLSGMLGGSILLTELTESNNLQFLIAAYFSTVLVFWHWFGASLRGKRKERLVRLAVYAIVMVCFLTSFFRIYKQRVKGFLAHGAPAVFLQKVSPGLGAKIETWRKETGPLVSADFIDAYTWLQWSIPQDANVLFGKHYEVLANVTPWWPETGFLRTALSGKQMYCENYKYKSIGMEKDFPLRFASAIHFYRNFVVPGARSQEVLESFYGPELPLTVPAQGKGERWTGRISQITGEMKGHLQALPATFKWAGEFLSLSGIDYIVLENGDVPSEALQQATQTVYKKGTVRILKVRKTP